MPIFTATAIAHPNIAFIKYWGNSNAALRLPANGSISMNLAALETKTRVTFDASFPKDMFDLNGKRQTGAALERVIAHINLIRGLRGISTPVHVLSENNFPTGAGIASSAAAFAALSLAAVSALGLDLPESNLSRLARRGSGSACRSIPTGFTEWRKGESDLDSFAISIAPPEHWNLVDCIAVVEDKEKKVGSTEGHTHAPSSPYQATRVADTPRRLDICRNAIQKRDFQALAEIIELDSNMMHSVMMTSRPALFFWEPATLNIIKAVQSWRKTGVPVAYTLDAGANVHVLTLAENAEAIKKRLASLPDVLDVLSSQPGGPAKLI
jgi:diphosphomevalonate decarboxylase